MARIRNTTVTKKPPPAGATSSDAKALNTVKSKGAKQGAKKRSPAKYKSTAKTKFKEPPKSPPKNVTTLPKVTWIINKDKDPTAVCNGYVYTFEGFLENSHVAYRCRFREKFRVKGRMCPGKIDICIDSLNVVRAVKHCHPADSQRPLLNVPSSNLPVSVADQAASGVLQTKDDKGLPKQSSEPATEQEDESAGKGNGSDEEEEEQDEADSPPSVEERVLTNPAIYTSPRIVDSIPTLEQIQQALISDDDEDIITYHSRRTRSKSRSTRSCSKSRNIDQLKSSLAGNQAQKRKSRLESEHSDNDGQDLSVGNDYAKSARTRSESASEDSDSESGAESAVITTTGRKCQTSIRSRPSGSPKSKRRKNVHFPSKPTYTETAQCSTTQAERQGTSTPAVKAVLECRPSAVLTSGPVNVIQEESGLNSTEIHTENAGSTPGAETAESIASNSCNSVDEILTPDQPTFVLTGRTQKHPPVILGHQIYNFYRIHPDTFDVVYRCISYHEGPSGGMNCQGELVISQCKTKVISRQSHSHPPNMDLAERLMISHRVRSEMCEFVIKSPLPVKLAYTEFRNKLRLTGQLKWLASMPVWKDCKKSLWRKKVAFTGRAESLSSSGASELTYRSDHDHRELSVSTIGTSEADAPDSSSAMTQCQKAGLILPPVSNAIIQGATDFSQTTPLPVDTTGYTVNNVPEIAPGSLISGILAHLPYIDSQPAPGPLGSFSQVFCQRPSQSCPSGMAGSPPQTGQTRQHPFPITPLNPLLDLRTSQPPLLFPQNMFPMPSSAPSTSSLQLITAQSLSNHLQMPPLTPTEHPHRASPMNITVTPALVMPPSPSSPVPHGQGCKKCDKLQSSCDASCGTADDGPLHADASTDVAGLILPSTPVPNNPRSPPAAWAPRTARELDDNVRRLLRMSESLMATANAVDRGIILDAVSTLAALTKRFLDDHNSRTSIPDGLATPVYTVQFDS